MKTYDVGIVALGFAGMAQVECFTKNPRTRVKAACTRNPERLKQVCASHGIEHACESYEQLLDSGLDVVVVCTPDHLHTDYCLQALDAGVNVLCEKPLVTELADAKKLVAAARSSGRVFMTGQCARFFPRSVFAKALIERGELGDIFFAEGDYIHDAVAFFRDWRVDPERPQNMVLGGGCHPLDLLRSLLGDITEVHARANKLCLAPDNPIESDCILLSLQFASGAIGKTLITIACQRPYSLGLSLYGTEGTLVDERMFLARYPGLQEFMTVPLAAHVQEGNNIFDDQAAHLVECLDEGKQPMADVVEGAKTVATCLAGIESLQTGQPVKVCNEF
jgi:UDP-N-acetylglucosamine 3-dehydrogenase